MPTIPPQHTFDSRTAHRASVIEPVAGQSRGDDLAVELRSRVAVVVVIVQARRLELFRLPFAQEAERRRSLKSQRFYARTLCATCSMSFPLGRARQRPCKNAGLHFCFGRGAPREHRLERNERLVIDPGCG